jgi:hypothetical protein
VNLSARPLSIEEIEELAETFVHEFIDVLFRMHRVPSVVRVMATAREFRRKLEELVVNAISRRDGEWTRALGVTDKVLTPDAAAKWLKADRATRARNVADARQQRGPIRW